MGILQRCIHVQAKGIFDVVIIKFVSDELIGKVLGNYLVRAIRQMVH